MILITNVIDLLPLSLPQRTHGCGV